MQCDILKIEGIDHGEIIDRHCVIKKKCYDFRIISITQKVAVAGGFD